MGEVEELQNQVKLLTEKLSFFENFFKTSQKEIIKQALEEFTSNQKKDSLKSEFDRKFKKSKKQIIKQKILEVIKTKQTTLSDLKYHLVNQLEYCSKASFYRYIEEMKDILEVKNNMVYALELIER